MICRRTAGGTHARHWDDGYRVRAWPGPPPAARQWPGLRGTQRAGPAGRRAAGRVTPESEAATGARAPPSVPWAPAEPAGLGLGVRSLAAYRTVRIGRY
eukprot:153044-Hanusia_phi.AAC.1